MRFFEGLHVTQEELGKQKVFASSEGREESAKEVRQLCSSPVLLSCSSNSTEACTTLIASLRNPRRDPLERNMWLKRIRKERSETV